jgi:integrase
VRPEAANSKHLAPPENRSTVFGAHAIGAIRLLIFTGARLREILHLRWEDIDFERGLVVLQKHKTARTTGAKIIVLNAPTLQLLQDLPRIGKYVIAGETAGAADERPRSDLKKPWQAVSEYAGLSGVRLHDLRHNFASFGAGGGLGLPIIGRLLGHTQSATTARYAHFDNDPIRKASNTIASAISAAMREKPADAEATDNVQPLKRGA